MKQIDVQKYMLIILDLHTKMLLHILYKNDGRTTNTHLVWVQIQITAFYNSCLRNI